MIGVLNDNISWMAYNTLLAVIPVFLGWLLYYIKSALFKAVLFIAWLLFVPNTIYLFTDIIHLNNDLRLVGFWGGLLVIAQYFLLLAAGFLTFIVSLYPVEKLLRVPSYIIGLNFLIGFGMVLGRVYRFNSWDVIWGLEDIILTMGNLILSPKMLSLALLFGLFANFLYFLFRKEVVRYIDRVKT
jgi:uncharacterized membrane protein